MNSIERRVPGAQHVLGLLYIILVFSGCSLFLTRPAFAQHDRTVLATIRNDQPRRDQDGNILDAHDGCLQFFSGRYYFYGTAYGKTAGYTINNRFRVYSSADLEHWTYEGELLAAPPDGVYYRPYVVYNGRTRKYVLWYNWYKSLWNGQVGVATSDNPIGPFTIQNSDVQLSQAKNRPGDGSLFVDDDGTGYFIYTVIGEIDGKDHTIFIEKLSPDFLSSTQEHSAPLGTSCEAPAMFRRGDYYYALFDFACCFCPGGSGARVMLAKAPLGPFKQIANINRDSAGVPIIDAQQTFIARIPTPSGSEYIWMGDRWKSRPDQIKGHDFQYWSEPLEFSADGAIAPLHWDDSFNLRVTLGTKGAHPHPYSWPLKNDPNPLRRDACYGTPLNDSGEPVEK